MNKNFSKMAIGAVASTIAGAYYLYGSREGQVARKNMAAWAVKMKGEMLEGIEKLKEVSEPKYKELVKKVEEKYAKAKADSPEFKKVVGEISSVWGKMKKEVNAEIVRRAEQIKAEEAKANNVAMKASVKKAVTNVKNKVSAKVAQTKTAVKKAVAKVSKRPAVKSVEVKTETEMPVVVAVENVENK